MRAAVIGTGKISAEHLRFLQGRADAQLVGVCDLSPVAAKYHAEQYGAEQAYTQHREMFDRARPDVVHILTPAETHPPLVRDALEAGAHVICEKPLALATGELDDLFALGRERGRQVIEDHNYRFNEPVGEIERMVELGELGEVREVEVRLTLPVRDGGRYADANLPHPSHRLPAGVIHEFVTHLAYLTLRFLPSVQRVAAAWSNHGGGDLFKYDDLDALVIGGGVHARIRFSAHAQPDGFELTVRGSRGYAQTDLFHPCLRRVVPRAVGRQLSPLVNQLAGGARLARASADNFRRKLMQQTPYEGLERLLGLTYDALERGEAPPVTEADIRQTSELVEALLSPEGRM